MRSAHFESSIISPSCFGWSQSDTGLTYFSNIFLSIYIVYVTRYVWISTSSKKTTNRRPKMRINCWTSKKPKIWLLRIRINLSCDPSQKLLLHPVALLRSIVWWVHFNREVFFKSYFWKSYVNYSTIRALSGSDQREWVRPINNWYVPLEATHLAYVHHNL